MRTALATIRPEAAKAWLNLSYALGDLSVTGQMPICRTDPDAWMSDDKRIRAEAADACRSSNCPVMALCDAFAVDNREQHGVWAGIDRTGKRSAA